MRLTSNPGIDTMQNLLQELRYGIRTLNRSRGFALAAVLVLALGIGANTAIFSVVNAVLLRPLPFPQPDRLVQIWHTPPQKSFPGMKEFAVSAANYLDWAAENHVFQQIAIYSWSTFNLTGNGEPQFVSARRVSSTFFPLLQAQPILGRVFSPEEDQPGHDHVVVLNESFCRNQFGADRNIVGRDITLDGAAYRVIGVMPAKFQFPISSAPMKLQAPRARLVRGVISETVVLSVTGGVLGLLIAHFGVKLIVAFLAAKLPRASDIGVDGWVLAFTVAVSLLAGIIAGLVPAVRLSNVNVNEALKQGNRTSSDA